MLVVLTSGIYGEDSRIGYFKVFVEDECILQQLDNARWNTLKSKLVIVVQDDALLSKQHIFLGGRKGHREQPI
jgi:hypothetical protein